MTYSKGKELQMLVTNPEELQTRWQAPGNNKNEVADIEAAIIVSIKVSWKDWNCTDEQKQKF